MFFKSYKDKIETNQLPVSLVIGYTLGNLHVWLIVALTPIVIRKDLEWFFVQKRPTSIVFALVVCLYDKVGIKKHGSIKKNFFKTLFSFGSNWHHMM